MLLNLRTLSHGFNVGLSLGKFCKAKNKHCTFNHLVRSYTLPEAELDDTTKTTKAKIGTDLLKIAHENDIELEGACEGSLACSTCHVIIDNYDVYNLIPEPTDEENDMLDLAFGLTETSRLGCQVHLSKELSKSKIRIPKATRNMMVDGYVPKPH